MNFESVFQLLGHTIKKVSVKNDFINMKDEGDLLRQVDFSHETREAQTDGPFQAGVVTLTIKVDIRKKEGRKIVNRFEGSFEIEGYFSGPENMDAEAFRNMLNINGSAALYSIARGFLISLSSQVLNEGRVLLPLVNFVARQNSEAENSEPSAP